MVSFGENGNLLYCLCKCKLILRQEIDGPQAEQLEFVPCGQILQDEAEEELSLPQIKDRDHIFLILKVKETFSTIHVQRSSFEVKRE